MPATLCDPPHPAIISVDELAKHCDMRTQRRSGPGGQHRNKTSSGVFLTHRPSGIVAEATERRSQADNRGVAIQRLRFKLAVELRTQSIIDADVIANLDVDPQEARLRSDLRGGNLRLNDRNESKPAMLALLLNDLHASGGQPSMLSPKWGVSTTAIVNAIRSDNDAFALLNRIRRHHGRRPLK